MPVIPISDLPQSTALSGAEIFPIVQGGTTRQISASAIGGGVNSVVTGLNATVAGGINNTASGNCSSVVGGSGNTASGIYSFVGGGRCNAASGIYSFVGGGSGNEASCIFSNVVGGRSNKACGDRSFVGGGTCNTASGNCSFAGSGRFNTACGSYSSVVGGCCNTASSCYSFVVGGRSNTASGNCSSVVGGYRNIACIDNSSVVGGRCNTASGSCSFVGGGAYNAACGSYSFVGGGAYNAACGSYSSVVGGCCNTACGSYSSVGNGYGNTASGNNSFVVGGFNNTASGNCSFVGGGDNNAALNDNSFVGNGYYNTASGNCSSVVGGRCNRACGNCSSVVGGNSNTASGNFSFVGGGTSNTACAVNSSILGGSLNTVLSAHTCSFIVGSNLTSNAACTTFVNNLSTPGSISTSNLRNSGNICIKPGTGDATFYSTIIEGGNDVDESRGGCVIIRGGNGDPSGYVIIGDTNTTRVNIQASLCVTNTARFANTVLVGGISNLESTVNSKASTTLVNTKVTNDLHIPNIRRVTQPELNLLSPLPDQLNPNLAVSNDTLYVVTSGIAAVVTLVGGRTDRPATFTLSADPYNYPSISFNSGSGSNFIGSVFGSNLSGTDIAIPMNLGNDQFYTSALIDGGNIISQPVVTAGEGTFVVRLSGTDYVSLTVTQVDDS